VFRILVGKAKLKRLFGKRMYEVEYYIQIDVKEK
jgi:hypothetical protein